MSTDMTWEIVSTSSVHTEQLAEQLGSRLRGGEVIELVSDLGGGKTTFTRGLARGAQSKDRVASPTFTVSKEYKTPQFTIVHFDFYRLGEAGIVGDELAEVINDPHNVTVVEWGDIVHDVLPAERLTIAIHQIGESARRLVCTYPERLMYLFAGVAV